MVYAVNNIFLMSLGVFENRSHSAWYLKIVTEMTIHNAAQELAKPSKCSYKQCFWTLTETLLVTEYTSSRMYTHILTYNFGHILIASGDYTDKFGCFGLLFGHKNDRLDIDGNPGYKYR